MSGPARPQALVVGSGAGGAVVAYELASRGIDVLVLEEGERLDLSRYGEHSPDAMRAAYRHGGMTPMNGRVPIGYVEGRCYGGGTEINSGFWHRTPREILLRWKAQYGLEQARTEDLRPHFDWAEEQLDVGLHRGPWPASTRLFDRGVQAMGWSSIEVPRTGSAAGPGGTRGMSRTLLPQAERHGARVLTGCRAIMVAKKGRRVSGVLASLRRGNGEESLIRLDADNVFVCAGPTETPPLLRQSGVRLHVGDRLQIHPMLKVAARFEDDVNAHASVLPLIQVREFWPDVSLGGAFFSLGHLGLLLSENWTPQRMPMGDFRRMALYYVAVRGTGRGRVRPARLGGGFTNVRYDLSREDLRNLSKGLAHLSTLLLAAGAREVYPAVHGVSVISSEVDAVRWLDDLLPRSGLSLTTVHAFGSCPIGERRERCVADSFGRVFGYDNLFLADASVIPDSPGVNPQATIMALARRNAIHFAENFAG